MAAYLELLPAVDIADGQAVQLVQGVAGSEKRFGDPVEAALRWQEAGAEWIHLVDLDAAFGRGHNRELQAEIVGTLDIDVEMSGGIRDDESLRGRDGRPAAAGSTSAPPRSSSRSGAPPRSRRTATGSPSASTSAAARSPPAAGPARAATSTRCWPGSTARAAPATSSPTSTRTACSRAPTSTCSATSAPPPTGRSSPPAASPSSPTSRRCRGWSATGVEGAIIGTALYEGRFTLEDALALTRPTTGRRAPHDPRRPRHPLPRRRRAAGWSRASTSSELRDAGDPVELARTYDAEGADELTFLDISASHEGRATTMEIVSRTAEEVFIPLTVGGGVGSVEDVDRLLRAGADKVAVNTAAIRRPELVAEIADRFGSQVLVLSVDARRARRHRLRVRGHHPRRAQVRRARRRRVGGPRRRARRRRDPAQRDGRRRHPGRLRPRR